MVTKRPRERVDAAQDFRSTGNLCGLLQRSPDAIDTAAEALGIVPAMCLNGVPHYSADQVARISEFFRAKGAHDD